MEFELFSKEISDDHQIFNRLLGVNRGLDDAAG
jgi:hypothetical protein